jgi:AcrR family transcriptional regulator
LLLERVLTVVTTAHTVSDPRYMAHRHTYAMSEAPLASRGERKQRTRARLLQAALELMGAGRSFASLSLREIAREAGVVPASFYRHFADLNALAMTLVMEASSTLRQMLREARMTGLEPTRMLRSSIEIYQRHVATHPLQFLFIAGERGGGSTPIRQAIRAQEQLFVVEMAQDLRQLGLFRDLSDPMLRLMCLLVVTTMMNAASDVLDVRQDAAGDASQLIDDFVRQLRLVFLGAKLWRE